MHLFVLSGSELVDTHSFLQGQLINYEYSYDALRGLLRVALFDVLLRKHMVDES